MSSPTDAPSGPEEFAALSAQAAPCAFKLCLFPENGQPELQVENIGIFRVLLRYQVVCPSCGMGGPTSENHKTALDMWNVLQKQLRQGRELGD